MVSDHVNSLMSLFQGRSDAYGIERGGKVWAERRPVCVEHFQDHLAGKIRLGIYPVNGTNSTHWAVIDFDTPDRARVEAAFSKLVERGFFPYLEASRSKGFHVWIFFDAPVKAELARKAMSTILQEAGANGVEIFPKQDLLGDGEVGNYVFLPLQGSSLKNRRTAFLKLDFTPHEDQWTYLDKIRRTPAAALEPYISSFTNFLAVGGYKGGVTGGIKTVTNRDTALQNVTLAEEGNRDHVIFHLANYLAKGGCAEEEAFQYLEIFANSCNPSFSIKETRDKLKSAMKRDWARERNMAQWVEDWVSVTSGYFSVTELYNSLQNVTSDTKGNIRQILHRFCKQSPAFLERHPQKNGVYRLVNRECEDIDFLHVHDQVVNIHMPFEIEKKVKTLPKNIIGVAGEPNAGKTALLLNTVLLNMSAHKVRYFSSEMGPIEMRARLSKFDFPLDKWTFSAKERSSNFADVIDPEAINVIDFLEVHDEFYKVGGMIKDIYDKLTTGIAIIAIQKNRGTDFGLGGMRGLEKARLYLAMEPGKIKIVKAKNWTTEVNPNGLCLDFKLVQGCKFIVERDWYRP